MNLTLKFSHRQERRTSDRLSRGLDILMNIRLDIGFSVSGLSLCTNIGDSVDIGFNNCRDINSNRQSCLAFLLGLPDDGARILNALVLAGGLKIINESLLLLERRLSLWNLYIRHVLILILAFGQGIEGGLSLESVDIFPKTVGGRVLETSEVVDAVGQGLDGVLLLVGELDVDQMLQVGQEGELCLVGEVEFCGGEVVDESVGLARDELLAELVDVALDGKEIVEVPGDVLLGVEAVLELVAVDDHVFVSGLSDERVGGVLGLDELVLDVATEGELQGESYLKRALNLVGEVGYGDEFLDRGGYEVLGLGVKGGSELFCSVVAFGLDLLGGEGGLEGLGDLELDGLLETEDTDVDHAGVVLWGEVASLEVVEGVGGEGLGEVVEGLVLESESGGYLVLQLVDLGSELGGDVLDVVGLESEGWGLPDEAVDLVDESGKLSLDH
jgi:hypothetical protein